MILITFSFKIQGGEPGNYLSFNFFYNKDISYFFAYYDLTYKFEIVVLFQQFLILYTTKKYLKYSLFCNTGIVFFRHFEAVSTEVFPANY